MRLMANRDVVIEQVGDVYVMWMQNLVILQWGEKMSLLGSAGADGRRA